LAGKGYSHLSNRGYWYQKAEMAFHSMEKSALFRCEEIRAFPGETYLLRRRKIKGQRQKRPETGCEKWIVIKNPDLLSFYFCLLS
jgi:hypothetical protein